MLLKSKMMNRRDARQIVTKYLREQNPKVSRKMHIFELHQTGIKGMVRPCRGSLEDCWIVYVPNESAPNAFGPSRIICVLKKTGEIVFDGIEGGKNRQAAKSTRRTTRRSLKK